MIRDEEKKAIERIEDFLTTNIIISISSDETANSEELKAFISKNEYLSIEFISTMFLKQSKEIEELKLAFVNCFDECTSLRENFHKQIEISKNNDKKWKDKIKAKIEEVSNGTYDAKIVLQSLLKEEGICYQ